MVDEIRRLSDELASNPGSHVFLRLGELLRQRRALEAAERVANRGRERHPGLAAAHDLGARIALDRGDSAMAAEAWRSVLDLEPNDVGAHKGLGFIAYRAGRFKEAEEHLANAAKADPDDTSLTLALETVRQALKDGAPARPARSTPMSTPAVHTRRSSIGVALFSDLAEGAETVLLVDKDGLVLAGAAPGVTVDRSAEIGAHLTGVSEEADRAMRHLDLGSWTAIVIEAPEMSAALSPVGDGALTMITAPKAVPLGLLRRILTRATDRSRAWFDGNGA
ncbi:MAG TPA: tetratricopeptide repeat protein [Gemmatimonadaceae bacterium]|nr:tetratricopeptide repeat protein [Gemmatimonadaceae bacterium]